MIKISSPGGGNSTKYDPVGSKPGSGSTGGKCIEGGTGMSLGGTGV